MHIISVGQSFDLEHHSGVVNQFAVRLADGTVLAINTDESTTAQLLDAAAKELGQTLGTVRHPASDPQEEPLAATEFGGDLPDPGEDLAPPEPPAMGMVEEAPEFPRDKLGQEVVRPADRRGALGGGHPNKKGRVSRYRTVESVPARTVPMDEKGNPIVPQSRSTMSHLGPGVDDDEDGTSI